MESPFYLYYSVAVPRNLTNFLETPGRGDREGADQQYSPHDPLLFSSVAALSIKSAVPRGRWPSCNFCATLQKVGPQAEEKDGCLSFSQNQRKFGWNRAYSLSKMITVVAKMIMARLHPAGTSPYICTPHSSGLDLV